MRFAAFLIFALYTSTAFAQLPPPTEAEKAKAAEIVARNAWTTKVGAYKLCLEMDRTATKYHARLKATRKDVPQLIATAPCTDPGPYVSPITAAEPQPREAAEAHSPAGTAVSPPNTKAKAEETRGSSSK